MRYRVGVDIGGTFTDIVLLAADGSVRTRKVSSSVDDYARAIAEGLARLFEEQGIAGDDIEEIRHGTTVASNAILEHKGARTGLITTKGFRDVLEIRNLRMPRMYDIAWTKPPPLVPRHLRVPVDERIGARGEVIRPLDPADAERAVRHLLDQGVEALAVCLLNAFANPAHEQMIKAIALRLAPDLPVSISSEVLPEIKEYERTSSTVINAYLTPIVGRYLARLEGDLTARGVQAPLLIMQSNGGLMSAAAAAQKPMHIVESGPAAGVVGAQVLGRAAGIDHLISFDMGGTTAKAGIIERGEFSRALEYQVGGGIMTGSRLLTGAGYLLKVPAIDLAEVGAGGGSLVRIDAGGSMMVGPDSAGAVPGPVCYDTGGDAADVTDASLILGHLNAEFLVGGALQLNAERRAKDIRRADRAAARPVARACRLRRAAHRQRQHDARDPRGLDRARPRPARLHLVRVRRQRPGVRLHHGQGARHAPRPGAARARPVLGLRPALRRGRAPPRPQLPAPAAQPRPRPLNGAWDAMEQEARAELEAEGFAGDAGRHPAAGEPALSGPDLRSHGARAARRARAGRGRGDRGGFRARARAHLRPSRRRGRAGRADRDPGERARHRRASRHAAAAGIWRSADTDAPRTRAAYFGPEVGWLDTPVLARAELAAPREGPCIIEEYDATCVVPPGARASLDAIGSILIEL